MKITKYKLNDSEFLVYGDKEIPAEITEIQNLGEVNLEDNPDIPIYNCDDFLVLLLPFNRKFRTRDKVLSESNIRTWRELSAAYYKVRTMKSSYSRREREYIVSKYSEIVNE